MSDEQKEVPAPIEGQEPEITVEELRAQVEQLRKTQAGIDRSYSEAAKRAKELEAENEKLKKEKMSEKERSEYEIAKREAEIEAKSKEVAEAALRLSKMRLMGEKKIPLEYADYIHGSDEGQISDSIDKFNKLIDKLAGERVNEKLLSTEKPKSGDSKPDTDYSNLSLKEMEILAAKGELKLRR